MGHRTLVAYRRGDGYDVHYAHWGVDPGEITAETPFGGPPNDSWARARATDLVDAEGGRLVDTHETAVDAEPLVSGLSFDAVCERVDPLEHEALYVVGDDWTVRTYLVVALRDGDRTVGALVGYEGETDAAYLRGWFAGARAVADIDSTGAIVQALRWLDPKRGVVVYLREL